MRSKNGLITLLLIVSMGGGEAAALARSWSKPFAIDGTHSSVIVTPRAMDRTELARVISIQPYEINYQQLSQQLRYYEWIYFTGQIFHGSLILMVKPKFVAY